MNKVSQVLYYQTVQFTSNMPIVSGEQFFGGKPGVTVQQTPEAAQQEPGYLKRVGSSIKDTAVGLAGDLETQAQEVAKQELEPTSLKSIGKTAVALGRGGLRTVGAAAKAALTPIAEAPGIKQATEFVGEKLAGTNPMQKFQEWSTRHPEAAKDIENTLDIAGLFGGGKAAKPLAGGTKTVAKKTVQVAKPIVEKAGQTVASVAKPLEGVAKGVKDVAGIVAEEGKRIPARISTNVAEKKIAQEAIGQLPSRVAREAAQDGLDMADIKTIYKIPKEQKAPLKKLATVVKDFAEGKTKTNPIEVVGKPIVNRLKELEKAKGSVGKKLGQAAEGLGKVTREELDDTVFNELKRVPGLSGLKKTMLGELDFSGTTLATELSKPDRMAVRKIFSMATKPGTGKSKHLLRQELFEILGGKKRSLTALTDTQEKAFEAVRRGLSNVLETKNSSYKVLSNQFRQIIQPLQELRKVMRVSGEADDVLDMSAGLLARRLTSFAQSNPKIKEILNAMDKATKVSGKTRLNVESLQDFYNILEKYYDIAPKTGFQAQVRQGVEKAAGGPLQYIGDQIKSFAGETPAVRQKALEKILEEVLK